MWAPVTVSFEGREWTNVGLRFKGTSSLRAAWSLGTDKMPFKLDFDEFEDDFPAIKNQRFHGFKQLSLSTNWNDPTGVRESLAYELLAASGLIAARTAFYEVVLDHGEGPKSLGLYTLVEVIDDTVVPRYFEDKTGTVYDAEGGGASLAAGSDSHLQSSFKVQSNKERADWSDIRALYGVLHSDLRFSDARAWRAGLEDTFDVDAFLKWLALAALLQHWDTYGAMTHNFYLYNDPATGRLNWISWDHNLVLGTGGAAEALTGERQGAAGRRSAPFDKTGAGEEWPLISHLLSQPEYARKYNDYLRALIQGTFDPGQVAARIEAMGTVVAPLAMRETPSHARHLDALIATVGQRARAAESYLASL